MTASQAKLIVKMISLRAFIAAAIIGAAPALMIVGQTKKTTRPVKTTTTSAQPVATPTPSPAKKNDRPQGGADRQIA